MRIGLLHIKKTEPWRFKIFKGERLKDLSEYMGTYYKENTEESKFSEMKYKRDNEKITSIRMCHRNMHV